MLPCRGGYWERCDVLVGLDWLRVIGVDRDDSGRLVVEVESEPTVMGCPACGVVAVWESIEPMLAAADADPSRLQGVAILGVDEHVCTTSPPSPSKTAGADPRS